MDNIKKEVESHLGELKKTGKTRINRQIEAEMHKALEEAYKDKPQPVYNYQGSMLEIFFPDYGKEESAAETEAK